MAASAWSRAPVLRPARARLGRARRGRVRGAPGAALGRDLARRARALPRARHRHRDRHGRVLRGVSLPSGGGGRDRPRRGDDRDRRGEGLRPGHEDAVRGRRHRGLCAGRAVRPRADDEHASVLRAGREARPSRRLRRVGRLPRPHDSFYTPASTLERGFGKRGFRTIAADPAGTYYVAERPPA